MCHLVQVSCMHHGVHCLMHCSDPWQSRRSQHNLPALRQTLVHEQVLTCIVVWNDHVISVT
jgi:hypothetical protein